MSQAELEVTHVAESDQWGADLEQFRELHRSRDPRLRDELVLKYQGLAQKIARRFASSGEPIEDLVQEGYLGLIKAVDRFEPEKGVKFITYATHTISGEIRHYLRDLGKLIQEPGWHAQLRYRILKCSEELNQRLGRNPEPEEIAGALDMKEETVRAVLQSGQVFQLESLDAPDEDDSAESGSMMERLEAPRTYRETYIEDRMVLRQAIRKLKKLERAVVYFFFYQEYSKTEIARTLGISVNYTSYLVKRALMKLRAMLTGEEEKEAALRIAAMEKKLAAVEKRVQEIETSDPETGLATKTQFVKKVREEVARARRYQLQFSLLVVQVMWGTEPQKPDERQESLLALTDLLRHCCRQVDLFSRFNDSTFAALLPHTGTGANVLGDRIVRAIAKEKSPFWVEAKYHTAVYPHDHGTAEALVSWLRRH